MNIVKALWLIGTTIILILSIYWITVDNSPEPYIIMVGTIISYLAFFWPKRLSNSGEEKDSSIEKDFKFRMKQKGGNNSSNYQSSGDININNEK